MPTPANADGLPAASAMESLYIQIIRMLPRNALSQAVGKLSDIQLPTALRPFVYKEYARLSGADLSEVERPLTDYPSVNAFFTRQLKPGLRPVATGERLLVSPVDGKVSAFGRIEDGKMVQTKGRLYEARDLLAGHHETLPFQNGHYITIYLSPKDYHRIHSPVGGHIRGHSYMPGHLFPVNPPSVKLVDRLFCVNERVCVYIDGFADADQMELGIYDFAGLPVALVMVGATCVGRMSLSYSDLMSNTPGAEAERVHFTEGRPIEACGEVGRFNLGSTVVLLFGDPDFEFAPSIKEGYPIRLGEPMGTASIGG